MTPEHAIYGLWAGWLASWIAAMFWSNRAASSDSSAAEVFFRVLFYASLILLFGHYQSRLWRVGDEIGWPLVALTAAGLLFTWWARIHLGPLWSDWVVTKAGHHVVDTGPYRLVRHPIYSGLILAALATAIEKGTSLALLGVAVLTSAFYLKARREERLLLRELGDGSYDAYARRTPMLIPFLRIPP